MPDVIRKINQLLESNDEFCRRIERSIEEIREEVRDLGDIVRNQAHNTQNENYEVNEVEEVIKLPVLEAVSRPNIPLIKPSPVNTHRYGKEENHRVMAYIAETMDLDYQEGDTEENNMYRKTSVKEILKKCKLIRPLISVK
ncbi:unnamed protein product [Rhizopus stolonifer]